jgi:hypothetical protein
VSQSPQPVAQASAKTASKPEIVRSTDNSGLVNVAMGKAATQSSDYYPTNNAVIAATLAVDGNVDGNAKNGTITHTAMDGNAWWEVDLGESEKIDHIVVWNRTDCCSNRLSNYWIFVANKPFSPADTVEKLRKNKAVIAIKGGGANPSFTSPVGVGKGRYVRIQLDGTSPSADAYLSVSEVEVYRAR